MHSYSNPPIRLFANFKITRYDSKTITGESQISFTGEFALCVNYPEYLKTPTSGAGLSLLKRHSETDYTPCMVSTNKKPQVLKILQLFSKTKFFVLYLSIYSRIIICER